MKKRFIFAENLHNMKPNTVILVGILFMLSLSCQKNDKQLITQPLEQNEGLRQIPIEEALATLNEFLQANKGDLLETKSGRPREIVSVFPYYGSHKGAQTETRATNGSVDNIPNAYLVNFGDGEGFAVLGANTAVAEIVAVTENGQIEDDLTVIFRDIHESYENNDPDDQQIDTAGYYCVEDDDFYSAAATNAEFVSECIRSAVDCRFEMGDDEGGLNSPPLTIKEPLLNISWGQEDPYNKYCNRRNLAGKQKSAFTGCSATAMAMIVAHNEYPQTLIINGETLDWVGMKKKTLARDLTSKGKDDAARLIGSIYNFVNKIAQPEFTLITPEQIKKRMQGFGYTNVEKHCASDFTYSMKKATSAMLADNKPVFISAIPKNWKYGHSWVIDGAKYSSTRSNTYLLHFNFGWEGLSNGYFSTSCLNPSKAEEYDDHSNKSSKSYAYSWHFRLITYDVPTDHCTGTIDYMY